jgi:phosphotriesterase-related protein
MKGQVVTVLGPLAPEAIGITMMHEHLLLDLQRVFVEPENLVERNTSHERIKLSNLSWVLRNWANSWDNLILSDIDLAIKEVGLFKQFRGGTLVDVTSCGLGRKPGALRVISKRTGINVIMGCSYYHAQFHPVDMNSRTQDQITTEIVRDIMEGVGDTGVQAGIIGEVGCSWPLHPNEEKVLRASALAQQKTGAPISIHPGLHVDSPFQILDILCDAGANVEQIVIGHMERTGLSRQALLRLASTGCYLEYDWFGTVLPTHPYGRVDVPSDGERIKEIAFLAHKGFGKKVLVSQDVCMKTRLASYGGPGYAHISRYVQEWMRQLKFDAAMIDDLLINNPARILTFA